MARVTSLLVATAASVYAIDNGKGITPSRGWRSWNLFGANVDQQLIMSQMTAIANRSRMVDGKIQSLCDLGYCDVGLDDNWQLCSSYGPNKYSYHDANGRPVVNHARFPDFIAMTDYAHSLGLTAGWYGNNCICSDHCVDSSCYQGDVDAVMDYGFDSIKLDGCGGERDLTQYAALFNATGKSILIENCHWGGTIPNATWCPWNYYRSSGDIRASYDSVVGNLQTTIPLAAQNLSTPGCWAYPDMLEVGCQHGPGGPSDPGLSYIEARTHFNAWCIVSSPLTLSHDMTNDTITDLIWPIITNTEALAVSAAYNGMSGTTFKSATEMLPNTSKGSAAVPKSQFFWKSITDTSAAVLLMNHDSVSADFVLTFSDIPGFSSTTSYKVRDINAHSDLGSFTASYPAPGVASHDSVFLMISA